jgi:hypothetical protein
MTTGLSTQDELKCVTELIVMAYLNGHEWLKHLADTDWRSLRYKYGEQAPRRLKGGVVPTYANFAKPPLHLVESEMRVRNLPSKIEDAGTFNILIRPDPPSEKEGQKWACILRAVPVVVAGKPLHMNFNIWFHGIAGPNSASDQIFGYRYEAPEPQGVTHNFYHAQPLIGFKRGITTEGCVAWMPETFPTIPVAARNQVELALAAVLTLGGKEALRDAVRKSKHEPLRDCARAFWGIVFGGEALSLK